MKNIYFVEVTDTFAGEANYSWVKRFKVHATSDLGAIRKVSRAVGLRFRKEHDTGDMASYRAIGACVCAFLSGYEDEAEHKFNVVSI